MHAAGKGACRPLLRPALTGHFTHPPGYVDQDEGQGQTPRRQNVG
jgi:hypothetical protein